MRISDNELVNMKLASLKYRKEIKHYVSSNRKQRAIVQLNDGSKVKWSYDYILRNV